MHSPSCARSSYSIRVCASNFFRVFFEFCSSKNLAHLTNVKLPGVRYIQRFVLQDQKSYANGAQGDQLNLAEQW